MQQHWSGYLKALGGNTHPVTSMEPVAPYLTSDSRIGVSGFLDLKPAKPQIQAKYDAMSGSWQGIQASESAMQHNVFKAESMPFQPQQNVLNKVQTNVK